MISVVVALLSLAVQQHWTRQQAKADARAKQYDRTQALILRTMDDPELLLAISGGSSEDQKQRRFRQLWVNHVEMFFRQRHLFDRPHWKGTIYDIRDFMNMPVMRGHWLAHKDYYAPDFQRFMECEVYAGKAEPRQAEAPPEEPQASTT
ncbi:hypothetical protein HNR46_000880 [Haloferula luteola]|uniref:Uncharacterized protein n=1 Tax=Haloferula luteola TaxID=595692 RepID=A0A840UXZ2_9BACT|nr:hypothetical protein [Haloferula luteola]